MSPTSADSMMNILKTAIAFSVLTLLFIFLGIWFGGTKAIIWALSLASVANFILYFFSDKIVIARYWAFQAPRGRYPYVYEIVERLSAKMEIPPPKIYWINTQSPNAFAVGRSPKHASIALTDGIVWLLSKEELEGVLGHELGHICNYDILAKAIAATLAGAFTLLLLMPVRLFLFLYVWKSDDWSAINRYLRAVAAPVAAALIRLWVSPNSEYLADAFSANYSGNPKALAQALQKLESRFKAIPMEASPSSAHLFFVQPLIATRRRNFLCSHPPVSQRIERLAGLEWLHSGCSKAAE